MSEGGNDFEDMYREVILDHYKNPRGYGLIEEPDEWAGLDELELK